MRRAGLNQRTVLYLDPPRGFATILYGAVAIGLGYLLVVLTLAPERLPDHLEQLFTSVGTPFRAFAAVFLVLCVVAAAVNGSRWHTARAVRRLSEDPALAGLLPDREDATPRPVATARPRLRVEPVHPPLWWTGVGPCTTVREDRNVLGHPPLFVVYLRVFENQPRSRTFVRGAWREFGHVHLLRSAAAVDPAEFRRARREGRLERLFLRDIDQLRAVLDRPRRAPYPRGWRALRTIAGSTVRVYDRYGSYRVRSLICHGSFWRSAVDELLTRADLVVLDLSGYRERNAGTQYELRRIVDTVPIDRALLLADPRSNRRFLCEQIEFAWGNMAATSPNARDTRPEVVVELAITDFFVQVDQQSAGGGSGQTRLELRSSRRQTRWLLARAQGRATAAPVIPPMRPGPGSQTAPDPAPPPPPRPPDPTRRRVLPVLVVTVLVAIMAVSGSVVALGGPNPLTVIGLGGTAATVRPGDGYHVRPGPSTANDFVATLPAGTAVTVDCLDGNWARLADPHRGNYVYTDGLVMDGDPPDC